MLFLFYFPLLKQSLTRVLANGFEAGSDEDIKRRRELAAAAAAAVEAPAAEVPKEEIEVCC